MISLMLLFCLGAETVSAAGTQGRAAEDRTVSESDESYPFGELPDMKLLMQAMDVIGDTPLDDLSEQQLSELNQLGFDQQTLRQNADLLDQLIDNQPDRQMLPDDQPDSRIFWIIGSGSAGLLMIGVGIAVYFSRRHSRH